MAEINARQELETQVPTGVRYPHPPPLTRAALPTRYIDGFFKTVGEAFDLEKKLSHPPGDKYPYLVEDYPKNRQGQFDTSFDVIQWSVVESIPAGTERDGYGRVPFRPRIRDTVKHPEKAGYFLVTTAWWEWVTVEFTTYAKTNRGTRELAEWFHLFLIKWGETLNYFRDRGIQKFQFVKRGKDDERTIGDNTLYLRRLQYRFRLEVVDQFEVKTLDQINVTVNGVPAQTITDDTKGF